MRKSLAFLVDLALALVIVYAALFIASLFVNGQAAGPAMEAKLWNIQDPADPVLAAAGVEAPAFLLEVNFRTDIWPCRDHQVLGLCRQIARLAQREWKLGTPIIIKAFVDDGTGETIHLFEGGAAGITLAPSGFSFYY